MAGRIAPKVSTDGLLMYLDVANPKSFRGEPTTNLAANGGLIGMSNISLVYLGLDGDWKKYGIKGTFTGDTYPYIMQITAISFTSGVTYTSKCTIRTNVLNKFNTFGISGINYVNQPLINVGVNSSVINSDGSRTVSRTAFAYSGTTTQPGYLLTNPINNTTFDPSTDFVWIKDLQIEQKSYATPYVNGTRGATVATGGGWGDISGKGKDGELTNSPTFSSSNLGSIVFDGVDDRVKLQNTNTWFPISTSAITIDTWVKSTGLASGNTYNGIVSLTYGLTLSTISNGNVFFRVYDSVLLSTVNLESTGVNCNDNKWHNIVGTNDGVTSKIYIDGVFNTSTPVTFNGSTNPVWHSNTGIYMIGWEVNANNRYFNGNISIIKSYNRALSDTEVLQNYNTLKSRYSFTSINLDTDAQAFITAAGITDLTQQSAINTLVLSLKSYGIWTKMKAIYPMVGGTATTHKFNLKDPRDLDAAFRLVFNNTWTHSSTGALPDGINTYADTKLIPSSTLTQDSTHLSYYSRTNISGTQIEIGCFVANPNRLSMEMRYSGNFSSDQYNFNTGRINIVNADSKGFYVGSRTNSTTHKAFKNNVQIGSTNTGVGGNLSLVTGNIYLGTANRTTEALSGFSTKECAFATIGDGLTDTEAANLYTAVQAYQTTLGRQV